MKKLSWIIGAACSCNSSEQAGYSNESLGHTSSDGFSSSSSDSSEDHSRSGHGKPATLSLKRALNQSSESAKSRVKPNMVIVWRLLVMRKDSKLLILGNMVEGELSHHCNNLEFVACRIDNGGLTKTWFGNCVPCCHSFVLWPRKTKQMKYQRIGNYKYKFSTRPRQSVHFSINPPFSSSVFADLAIAPSSQDYEKTRENEYSRMFKSASLSKVRNSFFDDPRPVFQELLERWLLSVSFRWVRKSSSISMWSLLAFVIPLLPFFSDKVPFLNLTIWHRAAPDMRYNATSSSRLIM